MTSLQLPTGLYADKLGGSNLMMVSLISWCIASALTPAARIIPPDLTFRYIFAVRALLGLAQSGIVTSTSAMAARCRLHTSPQAVQVLATLDGRHPMCTRDL